jgi:hypothetical protein
MDDISREQYSSDQLLILQEVGEANKILKKTFGFHTKIGYALMELSKLIAIRTGQMKNWPYPKGSYYNSEFSKTLASGGGHEAAEWVKEYASSKDNKKKESYRTCLMEVIKLAMLLERSRDYSKNHDHCQKELHSIIRLQVSDDHKSKEIERLNAYRVIDKSNPQGCTENT